MSQKNELARVKARIRALAEKTVSNGCTEAEAMAAAEMVGRLLERYAVTMEEIDVREAVCRQVSIPIGGLRRQPIDACVPAIARFCDCKVWLAREEERPVYVFFGFEMDTELALYLFQLIDRAMEHEATVFRPAARRQRGLVFRQALLSFRRGMASRLSDRLEEMHAAREASVAAQRSTGSALVIVKHGLVEQAFQEASIRLTSVRTAAIRPDGAYREGYAAGDRVNLNRPLKDGEKERLR